jgi:hypothetical protein
MFCTVIDLLLILGVSMTGILILGVSGHFVPEIFVALGFAAEGGLSRLMISPLNSGLLE